MYTNEKKTAPNPVAGTTGGQPLAAKAKNSIAFHTLEYKTLRTISGGDY